MLAIRRSDVDDLNGRARRHLEAAGLVHGPRLEIDERIYQAGDQIICLWNNYRLGVRNGDRGTIERVDPAQRTMRIRTTAGTRTLPADYLDNDHVAHGYAITIHKAQGATVDVSLVLGTDDLYRQAGYVALSRGRATNTLYTVAAADIDPDLTHAPTARRQRPAAELVRDALHRPTDKHLAIETAHATTDPDPPAVKHTRPTASPHQTDGRPPTATTTSGSDSGHSGLATPTPRWLQDDRLFFHAWLPELAGRRASAD